jgi:hypothetical protein
MILGSENTSITKSEKNLVNMHFIFSWETEITDKSGKYIVYFRSQ